MTRGRNVIGWDICSDFERDGMVIYMVLKLLVIARSDIEKVSLVMTTSKHDSLLGLFGLGRVISVTSCCIVLRSTNSINTSSGLETDGKASVGTN